MFSIPALIFVVVVTLGNLPYDMWFGDNPKKEVVCTKHYKWTTCEVVEVEED